MGSRTHELDRFVGARIRERRTMLGYTQQQLADYTGLDRPYISELERGLLLPSLETIFRLATQLEVRPKDMIENVETKLRKG
ncbi:MAG: helix-turn-helix transcriptional regulator [Bacteroidia bacterium]|nr:helix-turn-helix transcriptional regulator [Bacteroidia bacterium]